MMIFKKGGLAKIIFSRFVYELKMIVGLKCGTVLRITRTFWNIFHKRPN